MRDDAQVGVNALDLADANGHPALAKSLSELAYVELIRRRFAQESERASERVSERASAGAAKRGT
jgi:hypothetical protein